MTLPAPPVPTALDLPAMRPRAAQTAMHFEQLAQFVRSGVGLNVALGQLAGQSASGPYAAAASEMAREIGAGRSLADAMTARPGLYSPDEAATVAAGEAAGRLPDALLQVADAALRSHRLRSRLRFPLVVALATVLVVPAAERLVRGSLLSMRMQERAGGTLPPEETLRAAIAAEGATTFPAWAGIYVVTATAAIVWLSPRLRIARHALALRVPGVGARARAESLARFASSSSALGSAGFSARETFVRAAATLPNLALRRRFLEAAATMREDEPLSEVLRRHGLLPPGLIDAVSNAEMVGDVPGAMARYAEMERGETDRLQENATRMAQSAIFLAAGLYVAGAILVLGPLFYRGVAAMFSSELGGG